MSRRSRRAFLTVSIDVSIAPERQNSFTIDWATMFGEMYVPVAFFSIAAMVASGPAR